jgi:hypothetical protein
LVTVNEPVRSVDESVAVVPSQVAVSVNESPGLRVSCCKSCAVNPEFDDQTVWPFSVTLKPSLLGPALIVTGWSEVFLAVNVKTIGWPG